MEQTKWDMGYARQEAKSLIAHVISSLEGGITELPGDENGLTAYGLSSKYYLKEAALAAQGKFSLEDAIDVYFDDYLVKISGWHELIVVAPWLLYLLFAGRIHGSGDEDYSAIVQSNLRSLGKNIAVDGIWGPKTAAAFLSLKEGEQLAIYQAIMADSKSLVKQRQVAVSAGGTGRRYDKGIANRVNKEISVAGRFIDYPIVGQDALPVARGAYVRVNNASNRIEDPGLMGRPIEPFKNA